MSNTFRFQDLAKQAGGGENLAEGTYNFVVEKGNTGETKAGDAKVGLYVRVVDGPSKDQTQWLNFTFGEKAAAISARQLQSAGIPLPEEGGVEELVAGAQGVHFTADIKHNGDFVNLQNIKSSGAAAAPTAPAPATPPSPGGDGPGF